MKRYVRGSWDWRFSGANWLLQISAFEIISTQKNMGAKPPKFRLAMEGGLKFLLPLSVVLQPIRNNSKDK